MFYVFYMHLSITIWWNMIMADLKNSSLDNLKNWNIKMFPEIKYLKQFLKKNIIKTKDFFTMCLQSRKKKNEDYM